MRGESIQIPLKAGHHWSTKTPFKWRFAGGPMVAQHWMLAMGCLVSFSAVGFHEFQFQIEQEFNYLPKSLNFEMCSSNGINHKVQAIFIQSEPQWLHKTGRFACALYAWRRGPQNADIITEIVYSSNGGLQPELILQSLSVCIKLGVMRFIHNDFVCNFARGHGTPSIKQKKYIIWLIDMKSFS